MNIDQFHLNLASVLAHTVLLESKGEEPLGEAWAVGFLPRMFMDAPEVPQFKKVDTTKEQAAAVAGNIANFSDISKLAGSTNAFNQAERTKMLEAGSPGYSAMQTALKDRISGWIGGEVPKDVSDQIGRNSAYKSLSGGYSGSGMARNLVARDLGLTSLSLMEKGVDAGSRWLAMAKENAAPQFDVTGMFVTPEQQIQAKMFNTTGKFQRDWMKNQLDEEYSLAGRFNSGITETMDAL